MSADTASADVSSARPPSTCPSCGDHAGAVASPSYVYAMGRIEPRFPLLSLEKEFTQAAGRTSSEGLTDRELFLSVLSRPENRYLANQLCWVFTISDLDTYLLYPRNPVDMEVLVASLRSRPRPTDVDVVVGIRGPVAPPEVCNGLMVPLVGFTQIYSFDYDSFVAAVPKPAKVNEKAFDGAVEEILDRVLRMADNVGNLDEHRAINYLALRYPALYAKAYELFAAGVTLDALDVQPSGAGMTRNLMDVIFSFRNRSTNFVEKWSARVDVTEEFPFLVTGLGAYFHA
ncbi:hypothetical protein [Actinoplanes sp. NPDC049599]|uniref:cyanobactin maturation protease PatG family protein n=1 Tax=Actinoplanes sp. NPDC049599 TaxID=3363903 RepID=UPI00378D1342